MPEMSKPVQMVIVDYLCDECGIGRMLRDGCIVLMSNPIQIPHKCDSCGAIQNFNEPSYPRTAYQPLDTK